MGQAPRHLRIRSFPTLQSIGVAVQHFPHYVNTALQPHSVDVVLLSVIIRGEGQHVMGDRVYEEKSGSVGITHYGQVHDILTTSAGMDIYNVYLDLRTHALPVLPGSFSDIASAILPLHPGLRNQLNRSIHFAVRQPANFAELLARMEREQNGRQPGHEEVLRLCFQVFLIECCREAMNSGIVLSPSTQARYPSWLDRVRRELDRHYARPLSLDDLSEDARVSKGHLCRQFKQYTGKTVFEYLLARRIGSAMLRLRNSHDKVLAIAMECGFNDIAYFNRTFKRLTAQTPRAYRAGLQPWT
jgi:AraC-like DNA-binding protein